MLDVAPRLTARRRIRAFNELRLEHGLEVEDVLSLLLRFPRHPGARLLRPIVLGTTGEPTRSYFEDDWPSYADLWQLTGWDMNQHICGYRVDVIFLPNLLIVELDGWRIHGTPPSFERDREQDADILARTGIPTLRITHSQFRSRPATQAKRINAILDDRRQALA
jgi:very-short-patch-repair endonuclease